MPTIKGNSKTRLPVRKTKTRLLAVKRKNAPARKRVSSSNGKTPAAASPQPTVLTQKQQLEQERAQVKAELEMLRAELLEAPDLTGDEVDLNVYEREKTLGLVSAYQRRLDEIDAAVRAAEKGKYGICERCGNAIDPERLKIFPETRMCVKCKNEVEQMARRAMLK